MTNEIADWERKKDWRFYVIKWLAQNTSSLEAASYDRIRSYALTIMPNLVDEELKEQLALFKRQGILEEKTGILGGHYWFITAKSQEKVKKVCGIPLRPVVTEGPPPVSPTPVYEDDLVSGDIAELFKDKGLERLVLLLLRKKGYLKTPKQPSAKFGKRETHMDVWAETPDGTLILVECKGLNGPVDLAAVRNFSDRVRDIREDQPANRRIDVWIVSAGELSPDAEGLCQTRGYRIINGLDLIREVFAYGILGIGMKDNRPYVVRPGERGVFLHSDDLKGKFGDPTIALGVT
uniref:Putative restriction endonuclease n=1 Tax=viral metagenome TaxID=1070528 RepID=A0A6H1Z7I9_9ZZZZ